MWPLLLALCPPAPAADTGLAIDVSGGANPSAYADALSRALRLEAESRGLKAITFTGGARGTPMLGVKASAQVTVTCADGVEHEHAVDNVQVPVGRDSDNWQGVGKLVAERVLRDLECAAAPPPVTEKPPQAEVKPAPPPDSRVTGAASPEGYGLALTGAFGRALDGRPEITALVFHGSAKGSPIMGVSADAGADVTCNGTTHELAVEDVTLPVGEGGGWASFADRVVERLLRDLSCG